MLSEKRLALTTALGVIAGLCTWWYLGRIPPSEVWTVVLSRAVLGFAIGLSAWRTHWSIHGILMGIVFSLPGATDAVWVHMGMKGSVEWLVSGLVIGFLIELITTTLFHATPHWTMTPEPRPSV